MIVNHQFFDTNDYVHIDYDNQKMTLRGKYITDQSNPIPDPVVPTPAGSNTLLIIILVIVGVAVIAGIGFFCYKKKQQSVSQGLSSYDKL